MHDSYCEFVLEFGSSPKLLEQYINVHGGIRTGKLMEHLDSLAGSISYKHMLGPGVESLGQIQDRGFYIVTASVDRLDMLSPLDPSRDLRLSGQVIYTGKSSMEVAVKMETIGMGKEEETVLLGRFSMVCRDAVTHRARNVHPLVISTPEEQALYSMGEDMKKRRQSLALRSLSRVPPSSSEAETLHSFYLQYGQDTKDTNSSGGKDERVWMGDTKLEKCMLMFPQERNVHQKIFGGYLMRLAYELGFSNSSLFMRGGHVRFLSLDGIAFAQPVPIGSILRLTSYVLHSTSSAEFPMIVHVAVTANVVDVETGSERTTNEFRFTWCRDDSPATSRKVVPKTYKEAMLWLEGKRALELGDEIRGLRTKRG
ncbi:Thioesterase/thiol ester dehydrase-isomerase [Mycena latifolia]|nr:Thioesterase/thiol ester dehydrase-isomerase [Mycena latifolia]